MTDEATANSVNTESDSATPSTDLNNPSNWDFDDEQETPVNEAKPQDGIDPESEPDAGEEAQESDESEQPSDEAETDTEEAVAAPVEVNVPDDALVTLANGEKVKFGDLKKAPMFEKDYRHKTQDHSNKVRALGEQATRIQGVTDAVINFLAEQLPAEPAAELAFRDPGAFIQQKAVYDAAVARVQGLIEIGSKAKAETQALTKEQQADAMSKANDALVEALPQLRDPKKRQEFNQQTWDTARHFGFSSEELSGMTDHRMLVLGHYAAKGLKAEQAGQKVVQKVQAAPAATPAKRAAPKGDPKAFASINASRRLTKSGSFHDAMGVDIGD